MWFCKVNGHRGKRLMIKNSSKRFKKIIDSNKDKKIVAIDEAIKKVKQNCTTKFKESIDVSFNLNLKQKKEEVNIRTSVKLPHGNGKKIRVAVLCEDSKITEAKDAGADIAGSENLISDITSGKINFDKLVATPPMMSKMGKLGKILGPKGLMPNPKLGTVTNNVKNIVKDLKSGQIEIKNDKDGNLGASIGKKDFPESKIKDNFNAIIETLLKEKPATIKGDLITSAFLTSTMGISYKLKLEK
jgi:large subunit ribosomal protein L1